jgi:glycine dehydrogenase
MLKGISEKISLEVLKKMMDSNKKAKYMIGKGFYNNNMPSPIKRHILMNPKWYTPYTPYQAEISQGRLESLYNFQKMIQNITRLPLSNASLLDIGSTSAEVLSMSNSYHKSKRNKYIVSDKMHPYILDILKLKCDTNEIDLDIVNDINNCNIDSNTIGIMFQYPDTYGEINIPQEIINEAKKLKSVVSCSTDLLALTQFKSPGEIGADISFGSAQRFGIPYYYGGPHPAFISTTNDFLRLMPGRIVGKTIDTNNDECYRLALQSREQHIKKEKATSNICTSQALLANIAGMYAVYHGNDGIYKIANYIENLTYELKYNLKQLGIDIINNQFFDTLTIKSENAKEYYEKLKQFNYIAFYDLNEPNILTISLDETFDLKDINSITYIFSLCKIDKKIVENKYNRDNINEYIKNVRNIRNKPYLTDPIFNKYNNENDFTRYVYNLTSKDYTLTEGMIPLGSCTMKLNSSFQLEPLVWDKVMDCHPFAPKEYVKGYLELIKNVGNQLKDITGFDAVSFQSNSGSMGEYTALLCIKKHFENKRNICLIPNSAHGTNFSSASLANFKIVKINDNMFDNLNEFSSFVSKYKDDLAVMMITYPNTTGVFQKNIKDITGIIHNFGGLVYMDGANMNALAGIEKPASLGMDFCHLNLHKTFCIPHGGGGPGMGPILCKQEYEKYLPTNRYQSNEWEFKDSIGSVTTSLYSSASILTIPYLYLLNVGNSGLIRNTKKAIENANYIKDNIKDFYKIYNNDIAHEFIIDISEFKNVNEVDISKRLLDYSFHPPTMSWPIRGSLMIEPTESENKEELDRFIMAMISIRKEIDNNPDILKNAPHPMKLVREEWKYKYSMKDAFYPLPYLETNKFWPTTSRVNDLYGDKLFYKK